MTRLPGALARLPLPIIGSPLFIISHPQLVIAQCIAGVVGSMPALNARPASQLDEWLAEITEALAAHDRASDLDLGLGAVVVQDGGEVSGAVSAVGRAALEGALESLHGEFTRSARGGHTGGGERHGT